MVRARRVSPPDGRQNNGGARQGTPGQAYGNRTDLATQKITTAPGQAYGKAADQRAAQQVVPMAGVAPPPPLPQGAGPMQQAPPPPLPDLYRSTERPDEPVTHGLPSGPGAGSEALPIQSSAMTDPLAIQLRALYARFPSQELADLLADIR